MKILLFLGAFSLFFLIRIPEVRATPLANLCFETPQGETLLREFDGVIILGGRYLGRTSKGCIRYEINYCGINEELVYKTKNFPKSDVFFSFQIDSCRDNKVSLNQKQWKILQFLQENADLEQSLPSENENPFLKTNLKTGCNSSNLRECVFLNAIKQFYRSPPESKVAQKTLFLQLIQALNKNEIPGYRIGEFSDRLLLSCGLTPHKLQELLIENLIYRQTIVRSLNLPAKSHFAFQEIWGRDKEVSFRLSIQSQQKIQFFLLPHYEEYLEFLENKKINYSPTCSVEKFSKMEANCSAVGESVFLLINPGDVSSEIALSAELSFAISDPSTISIHYSEQFGAVCVVTDLTLKNLLSVGIRLPYKESRVASDPFKNSWLELGTQLNLPPVR